MNHLLISTLTDNEPMTASVLQELTDRGCSTELISTQNKRISHCIGCNDCWIKTPGKCCIQDDYEDILIKILLAGKVTFLTHTRLGFVTSATKHLFDRILPLATMHLKIKDGQMRHYSRYGKMPDAGLIYTGDADRKFLNQWLDRAQLNLHGKSLGAFPYADREELYHALDDH